MKDNFKEIFDLNEGWVSKVEKLAGKVHIKIYNKKTHLVALIVPYSSYRVQIIANNIIVTNRTWQNAINYLNRK